LHGGGRLTATVSTHVLDVARGRPAAGVAVELFVDETRLGAERTDQDGRISRLGGELDAGSYRIEFQLGGYFAGREHIFERVSFDLRLDAERHYHVPLLISPFGCTSYRGS
jgi:5-hydroxyisourate hydrolase